MCVNLYQQRKSDKWKNRYFNPAYYMLHTYQSFSLAGMHVQNMDYKWTAFIYKLKQLDMQEVPNCKLGLVIFRTESTIDTYYMKYLFCGFL